MAQEVTKRKKMALIASKGTLDQAYPPLILATTAAAMGYEVGIFFTFYGLDIINKKKMKKMKVGPVGNPAAPVPVPNIIGMLPGMTAAATLMMKGMMSKSNVATLPELMDLAIQLGVKLWGCQMTMDVMGVKAEDLMDGIDLAGAAGFLHFAEEAAISMFI
ncbi:MAG: DsrE/DsrF/DrsH-like family protein [Candidatus Kariarchaeaceae archaeon]|jgi:peroxiredoxin family protein